MKAVIKQITMENFKCYKNKVVALDKDSNIIRGLFGTGKTTIKNAWEYVLGMKVDFEPEENKMRVGSKESPIITTVEVSVQVNGSEYLLKRQNKQKYNKSGDYTGSDTNYWFDNMPQNKIEDYQNNLSTLFGVSYDYLLHLVDIYSFNTDKNKFDKTARRNILFDIFKTEKIVNEIKDKYDILKPYFIKKYDENNIGDIVKENSRITKKGLDSSNTLLDDKKKQLINYIDIDFDGFEKSKVELQNKINTIKENSNKTNKNTLIQEKIDLMTKLQAELNREQIKVSNATRTHNDLLYKLNSSKNDLMSKISNIKFTAKNTNSQIQDLQVDIEMLKDTEFNKTKTICPTCKRELEKDKIEKLVNDFETDKKEQLLNTQNKLAELTLKASEYVTSTNTLEEQLQVLQGQINAENGTSIDNSNVETLNSKITEVSNEISSLRMKEVKTTINTELQELESEIDTINSQLSKKSIKENLENEILELKTKIKDFSIKEQENIILKDSLDKYVIEKIETTQEYINKNFKNNVSYNFFTQLGANAENNVRLECEPCLNGITYNNLSNGQKLLVNMEICKTLQNVFKCNMPIWVDNFQDYNSKIESDSQLILIETISNKENNINNILEI